MKFIEGTKNQYAVSENGDVYSYKSGHKKKLSANINNGYYHVTICYDDNKKNMKIHRLVAAAYLPDYDDTLCVDHIDSNKLNNHIDNIRMATLSQNQQNRLKKSDLTSIYKGVYFYKRTNKWRAEICNNGVKIHIGYFETEYDAAMAYDAKTASLGWMHAKLNIKN